MEASGKSMPCDPVAYSYLADRRGDEKFITPDGKMIRGRRTLAGEFPDGMGYKPHWASCPAAEQFRRR